MPLNIIPHDTKFNFFGWRKLAFAVTLGIMLIGLGSLVVRGLHMGIDFKGGIVIDASHQEATDVSALRAKISPLNLGEVTIQTFGDEKTVLIRVQQQAAGDEASAKAVADIKTAMGEGWTYNRTENVGPTVGHELLRDGALAAFIALAAITAYVAFRFEWQFGVAALAATFHDVFVSLGLISVMGWEFNLTSVAALLLLAGYSVNDTVIVFDRIRETLRRYKRMSLPDVINMSVNATLSRTILTSSTTLLAILPMMFLGGETLINFTGVIVFGIFIGTFSSIYVAAALLYYLPPLRVGDEKREVAVTP